MSHTPGPWYCDGSEIYLEENVCIAIAYRPRMDEEGNWMPNSQVEANAKLIAAAPDLLAACEAVANDLQAVLDGDDFSGMGYEELFGAFLNVLRPAIAKAHGGEHGEDRQLD